MTLRELKTKVDYLFSEGYGDCEVMVDNDDFQVAEDDESDYQPIGDIEPADTYDNETMEDTTTIVISGEFSIEWHQPHEH